jgi:hypothetical protein
MYSSMIIFTFNRYGYIFNGVNPNSIIRPVLTLADIASKNQLVAWLSNRLRSICQVKFVCVFQVFI